MRQQKFFRRVFGVANISTIYGIRWHITSNVVSHKLEDFRSWYWISRRKGPTPLGGTEHGSSLLYPGPRYLLARNSLFLDYYSLTSSDHSVANEESLRHNHWGCREKSFLNSVVGQAFPELREIFSLRSRVQFDLLTFILLSSDVSPRSG